MEAKLLRSVPAGLDEEANLGARGPSFEEFYEASLRRLLTALRLVTGDRHEAEEIAQEAFVRVLERWDRVGKLEDPTGYLFTVSMNVFRSRFRRASLRLRRPSSRSSLHRYLAAVESRHEVVRLLATLPPQQRAAVLLTAILDYSAEEAGRMLGLRAASVRSLTTRARARMKQEVVDHP
jgi:RNA polymerase sigma-70 factor (ECF subfamily)